MCAEFLEFPGGKFWEDLVVETGLNQLIRSRRALRNILLYLMLNIRNESSGRETPPLVIILEFFSWETWKCGKGIALREDRQQLACGQRLWSDFARFLWSLARSSATDFSGRSSWQQAQATCNKKFILNNYKEQNISKAYSYVTSTVQGSDGVCFTLHDLPTRANKEEGGKTRNIYVIWWKNMKYSICRYKIEKIKLFMDWYYTLIQCLGLFWTSQSHLQQQKRG